MEKYLEIIRRTIELSETCLEGLEHIKGKLKEGQFTETIPLMNDSVIAFSQMEKSLQLIFSTLDSNYLESLTHSLQTAFDHTVTVYELGQLGKALEIFQFTLLPSFKKWKNEIEVVFHPYLVS